MEEYMSSTARKDEGHEPGSIVATATTPVASVSEENIETTANDSEKKTTTKKSTKPRAPRKPKIHKISLDDPELYLNRELAWLAFNERVLGEAEAKTTPLMERLKFIVIFHSNLDEFFMVRLSRLLKLLEEDEPALQENVSDENIDAEETLDEVSIKVRQLLGRAAASLYSGVIPALAEQNVVLAKLDDLSRSEEERVDEYFEQHVFPVLTPLALDPAHPFPYLSNLSLYLAVQFEGKDDKGEPLLAFVEIPQVLNRFVPVSTRWRKHKFVLLEDLIKRHLHDLLPWPNIVSAHVFRVTRNLDYQLLEGEVKDLLKSMESELKDRAQKIVVRLEVEAGMPDVIKNRLRHALQLDPSDTYEIQGMLKITDTSTLLKLDVDPKLRDAPFVPILNPAFASDEKDMFDVIRERDVLLHQPYESFVSVLEFLRQAAEDPNVLAIKQTLYRTGGDSPIIEALVRAAENGKQVTAVVELKARFDEHNNIVWAKRLERAGVHVVFGFVGLKIHAKCALVVRREGGKLQRYVHLSTGNYNTSTAKMYTDLGLLSSDKELTSDAVNLFNLLTGFNIVNSEQARESEIRMPRFEKMKIAPFELRKFLLKQIDDERKAHTPENPGHIILKMNALVDTRLVQALYRASQKGVKIDLIVRGMCVLRPGIPGVSDTIRVISVVDRFLEHSRVYWFRQGGEPVVYLASADFMQRNMDRRIEVAWPIENEELKHRIRDLLEGYLRDNCKSHVMLSDGTYRQNQPGKEKPYRIQEKLIEQAKREEAKASGLDAELKSSVDVVSKNGG